jgi:hypothetical protein
MSQQPPHLRLNSSLLQWQVTNDSGCVRCSVTYGNVSHLILRVDNQPGIVLLTEHTAGHSGRAKPIDVQCHFVRDRCNHGELAIKFVSTEDLI